MAQCAAPWSFLHGALMAHGAHLGRWQHPHLILRQGIDNLCYNKWPPQRSFPFRSHHKRPTDSSQTGHKPGSSASRLDQTESILNKRAACSLEACR